MKLGLYVMGDQSTIIIMLEIWFITDIHMYETRLVHHGYDHDHLVYQHYNNLLYADIRTKKIGRVFETPPLKRAISVPVLGKGRRL